jgi:hypothetical protein
MIAAMWPRAALVPVSVGRVDGWGMDDSLAALGVVAVVLLSVAIIGAVVPQHGGRVTTWWIFGRPPNGLAAITAILNAGMGIFLIEGVTRGALLQGPVGVALGIAALLSATLITVAWWVRRLRRWMGAGLLLSVAVWSGVCAANIATAAPVLAWIGGCLAALYVYVWLAEVTDIGGDAPGEQ